MLTTKLLLFSEVIQKMENKIGLLHPKQISPFWNNTSSPRKLWLYAAWMELIYCLLCNKKNIFIRISLKGRGNWTRLELWLQNLTYLMRFPKTGARLFGWCDFETWHIISGPNPPVTFYCWREKVTPVQKYKK